MAPFLALLVAFTSQTGADPRLAHAFREDKAGWVFAHLQGTPQQIGFQYGYLLSPEIDDAHRALIESLKATGKDWEFYRTTSRTLFWNHVPAEYQEEMKAQAAGLDAKGLHYDVWDVLAFNSYIEVSGYYLPWLQHHPAHKESCSAFIATGSETRDGKIVMGHNLWWDYEMGERFNAILDIQPVKGHHFMMDALCGFIHSGSDFAENDAGLVLCETTLPTITDFDPNGVPEFVRMRQSIQYATNLDQFADIMTTGNNGGYANTWLVGDTKTGEIGRLELGLKNVEFTRTKDGYFDGANFPINPKLISEETTGWDPNPQTNGSMTRRERWHTLLDGAKGNVDASNAKTFLGDSYDPVTRKNGANGSTLCGEMPPWGGAVNAKVTTSELAGKMQFWARMGVPNGDTLNFKNPQLPLLRPLVPHRWVLFTAGKG